MLVLDSFGKFFHDPLVGTGTPGHGEFVSAVRFDGKPTEIPIFRQLKLLDILICLFPYVWTWTSESRPQNPVLGRIFHVESEFRVQS